MLPCTGKCWENKAVRKSVNGIWVTEVQSPDGATAVIADHGAHLLSWKPADGIEALYLSPQSKFGGNSAIRGGVPIIFPQFGERGSGTRHGFARLLPWHQEFFGIEDNHAVVRFRLSNDDVVDFKWPHQFDMIFDMSISARQLNMSLTVRNRSDHAWEFCAALHTYLGVSDIANIEITGQQDSRYLDQVTGGTPSIQDAKSLRIDAEVDRIYQAAKMPVTVNDRDRTVVIRNHGFSDVVVWNPGKEKAAQMSDLAAQDYRSFVCVEAAAVDKAVRLAVGETWSGSQHIMISSNQTSTH
jgi:glucose-6-phosphate 1-epimerase